MSRRFVIGDIHGAWRALKQCLERSGFNYETDQLICLGDVCDGWPETNACIEELLKIKNLVYVLGNHDWWTLEWMTTQSYENIWYVQGGAATINSYRDGVPSSHISFLGRGLPYYLEDNKLFVHAGIMPGVDLEKQTLDIFLWDRHLARTALDHFQNGINTRITRFETIYVGHTPIPFKHPIHACEVWLMDTGAGWSGVLSMMDMDTNEIFVSDEVPKLYPGITGRTRKN